MAAEIVFDKVWKKFRRGERHDSLRDLVVSMASSPFRRARTGLQTEEFWAIQDVSFEVGPGEALGIIGPNGAGKSTTLKLLTKILKPTSGHCHVRGRTGALIEVAAGFHPDLTGRENVYLQGAILGMRRAEVQGRFDEIVDFAGIGEFIDTPVKRYSSGMNARLGFAIAVNLDPEVLIIDEVLSVGDMAFQERCIQKMRGFKERGVAIVFVSHNLQAIGELCERAVHLNHGVQSIGPTAVVLDDYVKSRGGPTGAPQTSEAAIRSTTLTDRTGQPVDKVEPGAELKLTVEYSIPLAMMDDLTFGVLLHRSTDLLMVYGGYFTAEELGVRRTPADDQSPGECMRFKVDYHLRANVTRGHYHFDCNVFHLIRRVHLHRIMPAAHLSVYERRTLSGVADLDVRPVAETYLHGLRRYADPQPAVYEP
ncbi:MAG: ABC transporter ATP-binding protein [Vicinamibacterales bacterium]